MKTFFTLKWLHLTTYHELCEADFQNFVEWQHTVHTLFVLQSHSFIQFHLLFQSLQISLIYGMYRAAKGNVIWIALNSVVYTVVNTSALQNMFSFG